MTGPARCANCGAEPGGEYCCQCGQRQEPLQKSVPTFLGEMIDEFSSWDSRVVRTVGPFFFRPGFLTRAYWDGKRTTYSSPLRLYIFASLICFFTLALSDIGVLVVSVQVSPDNVAEMSQEEFDAAFENKEIGVNMNPSFLVRYPKELTPENTKALEILDRAVQKVELSETGRFIVDTISQGLRQPALFNEQVNIWLSRLLIVFVTIFALLMALFFWRRYFVEHLIFAFHAQSFALIALSLTVLFTQFTGVGRVWTLAAFAVFVQGYTFMAMKIAYQRSWIGTVLRYVPLMTLYILLLVIGGVGVMVAAGWSVMSNSIAG